MDDFAVNPFWIYLQTIDWITVVCFYVAGMFIGFRMKSWTVRGTPSEIQRLNRILKTLKIRARKHYGKRHVDLATVERMLADWKM